jgi:hypothetical protein
MAENEIILKQRNAFGFDIQIKLVDGRELQIVKKGKKIEQVYSIDILSLQDKSKKVICIAWRWLIAGVLSLLFMLILIKVLPGYLNENKNLYLSIVLLIGVIVGIVCFIKFWKQSSKKQIFYSRNAKVPLIILSVGNPTKKTFSSFINLIEKRIKKFRSHMKVEEDKQLTGEMKMLRRLSDDGVISKKDYEKAKSKLFSGFDSNFINREESF